MPGGAASSLALVGRVLLILLLPNLAYAQCVRDTYSSLPLAPVYPSAQLPEGQTPPLSELIYGHWSEVAVMHRPPAPLITANPSQTNCPHLTGTLVDFHSLGFANGQDVNIPANTRVLVSSCSVPAGTVYNKVTIPATAELVFGDATIHFQAKAIHITGGKLLIGSETCRLRNKVTITLHGSRGAQAIPGEDWTKGILSHDGTIEVHGALYFPTWTRLAKTIEPGDDLIFIQDLVNWQVGQSIVVSTTEIKDSRDFNRNEERIIAQVYQTIHPNVAAVRVTEPFAYKHYGGRAYQAEVALLSRNILIQGDPTNSEPTDTANAILVSQGDSTHPNTASAYLTGFGVHIRMQGSQTIGRFSGVEVFRAGQTNVLGRYAIHFHQIGQSVPDGRLFVKDCSVHRSYFRAYAIHGTNNVHIHQNVGYDVIGHMYFLEDGIEENNKFEYNFGALVHWLGPSQNHDDVFGAQVSFWVSESPNLILPSDIGASVYYITNAHNYFLGNAASGGFAGFAFVNLPAPVKLNEHHSGYGNYSPMARPLLLFRGNTAHSTAYWNEQVGAVYVGGTLKHDPAPGGPLKYTSARDLERHSCAVDPSTTWGWCTPPDYRWMRFEDTKVFLANRGMQHWGSRSEVIRAEAHDIGMSMNVFGTVQLKDILVQCRSYQHLPTDLCPNNNCRARDRYFWERFNGFQWYDVGQNHIVTDIEFRNCNPNWPHCRFGSHNGCGYATTFSILTHSHRYVPENMQVTRNIRYTASHDVHRLVKFTVPQDAVTTVSGRLANWVDMDATVFPGAFPKGTPLILGSAWANNWWRTHANCLGPRNDLLICPKGGDGVASVYVSYDAAVENDALNGSICPNGEGPCPTVGMATHFGRTVAEGLEIGQNAKVTGPVIKAAGGWFVRFNGGSPRVLKIGRATINPEDSLVMAFPYPSGTAFSVRQRTPEWCGSDRRDEILTRVYSLEEVRAGFGDKWYYDPTNQVLYLRVVQRNEACLPSNEATLPWTKLPAGSLASFTREGLTLMMMEQHQNHIEVLASNCGGSGSRCALVPGDYVPPAMATSSPVAFAATWAPTPATGSPTLSPTPPCAPLWGTCGNAEYTGCCQGTAVCVRESQWYAQCQPGPAGATARPSAPPTTGAPTHERVTASPTSVIPPPTTPGPTPNPVPVVTPSPMTPGPTPNPVPVVTPSPTTPGPTPNPVPVVMPSPMTGAPSSPPPSSHSSPTLAPATAGGCAALYAKCGGEGWSGPTCCAEGTCVFGNPWYSQCEPLPAITGTPTLASSSTPTGADSPTSDDGTSSPVASGDDASPPTGTASPSTVVSDESNSPESGTSMLPASSVIGIGVGVALATGLIIAGGGIALTKLGFIGGSSAAAATAPTAALTVHASPV